MASSGIFRTINGERVELTAKQVKAEIMKIRGWTSEQYTKEYDKIRNRIRSYEGFQRLKGDTVTPQSPQQFLYTESRSMQRYGTNYRPSARVKAIRGSTSISSGKALEKLLTSTSATARKSRGAFYRQAAEQVKNFSGLIAANPVAAKMAKQIKDPAKLLQALKDFAQQLHIKIDEEGEAQDSEAIPFGATFGSDIAIDFDFSDYL